MELVEEICSHLGPLPADRLEAQARMLAIIEPGGQIDFDKLGDEDRADLEHPRGVGLPFGKMFIRTLVCTRCLEERTDSRYPTCNKCRTQARAHHRIRQQPNIGNDTHIPGNTVPSNPPPNKLEPENFSRYFPGRSGASACVSARYQFLVPGHFLKGRQSGQSLAMVLYVFCDGLARKRRKWMRARSIAAIFVRTLR